MAVPKRRTSKQRKRTRRAHWKASAPTLGTCPQCHKPKLSHRACPYCGYYNGRKVIAGSDESGSTKQ